MKWYKHLTESHDSLKIQKLMLKHGIVGYGMYFYCLELVAQNITSDNIDFELKIDSTILADRFKINGTQNKSPIQIIEEIMIDLIRLDFFQQDQESGKIYAWKLAERIDNSIIKNPQLKKVQAWIRQNKQQISNNLQNQRQIPETLPNESTFPDLPGFEEMQKLFPENHGFNQNSGKNYSSMKIQDEIPENPRKSRLELDKNKNLELELEREREENPGNLNPGNLNDNGEKEFSLPSFSEKKLFLDWVYLTDQEYKAITSRYGQALVQVYIKKLNNYIGTDVMIYDRYKKKNHYYVLLTWMEKDNCPELVQIDNKKICPVCNKPHNDILGRDEKCKACTDKEIKEDRKEIGPLKLQRPWEKKYYYDEIKFFD